MLVRDLIKYMHPTEVVKVRVYNNKVPRTTLFEGESLGDLRNLKIPEDVLNREVDYYTMFHNIVTFKGKEEDYKPLPYIKLELSFNIAVYSGR